MTQLWPCLRCASGGMQWRRRRTSGYRPGLVDLATGQISREIFVNEDIYAEEQEKIFARAWLFVGHESQVPNPGDYFVSSMGEEAVILCRDRAGDDPRLPQLLPPSRHESVPLRRGQHAVFTCPYHGWSYGTDGRLVGVPYFREAYIRRSTGRMGPRRGRAVVQLQGLDLGHLGPRGAVVRRVSRRLHPLSRPAARRLGRPRGPGRGAVRRPEMAGAVQLEVPGREFLAATPTTTSATARSISPASGRRAAAGATSASATSAASCMSASPTAAIRRSIYVLPHGIAAARLPERADRRRVFRAIARRRSAAGAAKMARLVGAPGEIFPEHRAAVAPAAHDGGLAPARRRTRPNAGASSSSIATRRARSRSSCATTTSATPAPPA